MDKLKNCKILQSMDARLYEITEGVDKFMENILQWADELQKIVENEFSTKSEAFTFQLPKTPCEKKIRSRRTKNTATTKCSATNLTLLTSDINNMDASISTRTRAGRRVLTSKMSQLNISTGSRKIAKVDEIDNLENYEKNAEQNLTNETFVLQNAPSTRTKPVIKTKNQNEEVHESIMELKNSSLSLPPNEEEKAQRKRSKILKNSNESSIDKQNLNKISGASNEILDKRQSKSIFSKTVSLNPVRQNCGRNEGVLDSNAESTPEPTSSNLVEKSVRRKISRALSESPIQRPSKYSKILNTSIVTRSGQNQTSKTINNSPEFPCGTFRISRAMSQSPIFGSTRISSLRDYPSLRDHSEPNGTLRKSSLKNTKNSNSDALNLEGKISQNIQMHNSSITNNNHEITALVQEPLNKTPIPTDEYTTNVTLDKTLKALGERDISTLLSNKKESLTLKDKTEDIEKNPVRITVKTEKANCITDNTFDSFYSLSRDHDESEKELSVDVPVPKKKKKFKKERVSEKPTEETQENIRITRTKSKAVKLSEKILQEPVDNIRITRTKSKAIKEKTKDSNIEPQEENLTEFARKILNKAKQSSQKKSQLAALIESCGTPKHRPPFNIFPSNLLMSKNKYHLLLSSAKKKHKTPLATLPNSSVKKPQSVTKKYDSPKENIIRSVTKTKEIENEIKLKTKKKKEDEAAKKRQKVIQNKKEELKRKNELKHQLAMKQREKLEQEKYNNMIQTEKEKEERHKIILQERQMKQKEETFKKKMLMQQKIAETNERRRLEEEARIAKLKEIEAEEQRIALEKQKEQERQEKREQERLALKKAREEYEVQVKRELEAKKLKAEKAAAAGKIITDFTASASKMQSVSKKQRFGVVIDKKEWDYKPRNENDYGLEDEHSEIESDDEKGYYTGKPTPAWATRVLKLENPMINTVTLEMLNEYMNCHRKTPDILKMFNMTPTKKIKRTSSAIWNTPTS